MPDNAHFCSFTKSSLYQSKAPCYDALSTHKEKDVKDGCFPSKTLKKSCETPKACDVNGDAVVGSEGHGLEFIPLGKVYEVAFSLEVLWFLL